MKLVLCRVTAVVAANVVNVMLRLCWRSGNNESFGSSAPVISRWLGPGNRTFLEVDSMVITWWILVCVM